MEFDADCRIVTLWVANRFKLDWIRSQYFKAISHTLQSLILQPVDINLALRAQSDAAKEKKQYHVAIWRESRLTKTA